MESSGFTSKLQIFLRNLIRDRASGSIEEYQTLGGYKHISNILQVDTAKGVSSIEVTRRRVEYGSNEPVEPEMTTYFGFLIDAFSDFTVIMLCCAAGVSLVLAFAYEKTAGSYAEGFAILASVLLVTNVTAINDYRKQSQFIQLNAAVDDVSVRCFRDGILADVRSAELVCGDIVQLNVGDILTVDGVLFQSDAISTDESALTGEPKLIRKDPISAPYLLSGTKVMEGSGAFIVIAVGENSEAGQIREMIRNKKKSHVKEQAVSQSSIPVLEPEHTETSSIEGPEEKSVLTAKLDRIAMQIGKGATVIAVVALLVMTIRYSVQTFAITNPDTLCVEVSNALCSSQAVWDYAPDPSVGFPYCSTVGHSSPCCTDSSDGARVTGSPCPWMKNHLGEFLSFLITAITILVVAVPEGLPLAVTLSLAFSVRQMQNENNLVKHLDACETMGSATTICSDKTGTLTKNRMTVVRSMVGIDKTLTFANITNCSSHLTEIISETASLSGTADIVWNAQVRLWDQVGSKTECALLQCVQDDLHLSYADIRASAQPRLVKKFPFASAVKKSGFLIRTPTLVRLCIVGASEMVLENCGFYTDSEGRVVRLSNLVHAQITKTIEEFANLAMRTVCLAYKEFAGVVNPDSVSVEEKGLIFLALVGIEDPLRDEVPEAIRKCNRAGVDVKMVTGDNLNTAIAIARSCNIIRASDMDPVTRNLKPNVAMTGPDFRRAVLDSDGNIRQYDFDQIWPSLRVLARSSPTDKYVLVSGMIDSRVLIGDSGDRQVVAVTGDGTNDAPALKRADVGFAMGITGTAVARDAADIILLDDNFASIVVACKWGRNVFDSIAKFLQFQLTVNVVAVVIALEGAFINNESPIGAVQMLWVNLIMDALASLALATEPPTEALLDRKPQGRHASPISNIMAWNIIGQVIFQLVVLNLIFFCGPNWLGIQSGVGKGSDAPPSEHYTLMFNALVVMQLTNQINSRKLYHELNVFRGLLDNMFFVTIVVIETVLQVIFVQFGGEWVHTAALPGSLWAVSVVLALGSFPVYWFIVSLRKMALRRSTVKPVEIEVKPTETALASMLSPLPEQRKAVLVSHSAHNLGRLGSGKLGGSGSLRAFSTRNLRDLVTVPNIEELKRRKTGGFKNPRRQAATNERFRKLYSFADSSAPAAGQASAAEFVEAAKAYHNKN